MHVEIWSDIACPWCYVGKRRFEAALASYEHRDEVTVTWRSFELDPGAPAAREQDAASHLAEKYGMSREKAAGLQAQMTETAAADGLEFRFDLSRGGNTFDAHRVVHLAAAHGKQDAMKERIMRAYQTEGELISDHETRVWREPGQRHVRRHVGRHRERVDRDVETAALQLPGARQADGSAADHRRLTRRMLGGELRGRASVDLAHLGDAEPDDGRLLRHN